MNEKLYSKVRTDLALEEKNSAGEGKSKIKGIKVEEEADRIHNINVVRIEVLNKSGEEAIKRPQGTYITMEVPELKNPDDGYHREISVVLAKQIKLLMDRLCHCQDRIPSVLVAGLGNFEATPDALGPKVVSNLFITRHFVKYMDYDEIEGASAITSGIIPGVMAQTGMETSEIINAIIKKTGPDILIVVDSLAARSVSRLNATIQITNTGILPGSGIGNDRMGINKRTMGVPVIAIGVPTVVDAATLVYDAVEKNGDRDDFYLADELKQMYVTPKDIDAVVKRISFTISEGINICMGLG